jgi:hypothetical protein
MAGVLFVSLPARPAAQGINVSGEWAITVNTDGGPIPATLVLKQEGEKVTGSIRSEQGELQLEGTMKEKTLSFSFVYPAPDGSNLTITMSGTVEGDEIKGTADFGGMGSGDWSAKKK